MTRKWTKKELSLRAGIKELAAAVLEQWVKDGRPNDKAIETWKAIYQELDKMENAKRPNDASEPRAKVPRIAKGLRV